MSFQRIKTWKTSRDPDYAAKKARVAHLYAIADGKEQGSMIRRYIIWRNKHAADERLCEVAGRANVA